MKVKVIANAFYNLTYLKPDMIIEYKGSKLPSWAVAVKQQKKEEKQQEKTSENNTPNEQKQNDNIQNGENNPEVISEGENTPELNENKELSDFEKEQYMNMLIDRAMEKGILIDDLDKKTIEESISELEKALKEDK